MLYEKFAESQLRSYEKAGAPFTKSYRALYELQLNPELQPL